MIPVPINLVKSVIASKKAEIDSHAAAAKKRLKLLIGRKSLSKTQKQYVKRLHDEIDKIIVASPLTLARYKTLFGAISPSQKKKNGKKKSFKDKVLDALQYDELRGTFYPQYFLELGIKSCIYCNSQLTVSVERGKSTKAKFQVDHSIPKSDYPCFSIALFNLYPVCGPCNNSKSTRIVPFSLYSSNLNLLTKSKFSFQLDQNSVANYLLSRKLSDLRFTFHEPKIVSSAPGPFQTTFDIEGIYNTQKDLIEELLWKKEIYTPRYKKDLQKAFAHLFPDESVLERMIIGNYVRESEIHKRPMSKFMQDIADQLGLLA